MKNELVAKAIQELLATFAKRDFPAEIGWQLIRRRAGEQLVPSDAWSPGNRWLMLSSGTTDARGFGQWHQVGRRIKPGSKALFICAPNTRKVTSDEPDAEQDEPRQVITGFRWQPVFKVEDTSGKPLPTPGEYKPAILPPLFETAAKLGVTSVTWQPFDGRALGRYRPGSKEIVLSEQSALTLYHELIHHLDGQIEPIRPGRLAEAEIVAEFGGAVLCSLQGISGYESSSYRYLRSYAEGKDAEAVLRCIMAVAARVERLVGVVLDAAESGLPASSTIETPPASISA